MTDGTQHRQKEVRTPSNSFSVKKDESKMREYFPYGSLWRGMYDT